MYLLDVVFPKRCLGCGRVGKYFCSSCTPSIKTIHQGETVCPVCEKSAMDGITHPHCKTRYALDGLTSFFHYRDIVQKAIKSLKYRFVSDLALEFISLVPSSSQLTNQPMSQLTILVPIPLHPSRFRYRGFNQAERLGIIFVQRLHMPMRNDVLNRVVKTLSQVEVKDREKRLKNMEKAFVVNKVTMQQINHATILLFDDVWTTGATMRSAANALKHAGASFVWGVTMAR